VEKSAMFSVLYCVYKALMSAAILPFSLLFWASPSCYAPY